MYLTNRADKLEAARGAFSPHLIHMLQLLLILAHREVCLRVLSAALDGCEIIGKRGLLLGVKSPEINLLSGIPDVRFEAACPAVMSHTTIRRSRSDASFAGSELLDAKR
jgi:hypothetical protein